MGIASILLKGRMEICQVRRRIEINCNIPEYLQYDDLTPSDWGLIYEKYVGQIFEDEGYQVMYNGLSEGYFDKGIDLIASNEQETIFIQCKYLNKIITKSKIDWILYKASAKLLKSSQANTAKKRLVFMLITKTKEGNFSKRMPKGMQFGYTDHRNIVYPMLQYFLDHNHTQDKVKLAYREIPMEY